MQEITGGTVFFTSRARNSSATPVRKKRPAASRSSTEEFLNHLIANSGKDSILRIRRRRIQRGYPLFASISRRHSSKLCSLKGCMRKRKNCRKERRTPPKVCEGTRASDKNKRCKHVIFQRCFFFLCCTVKRCLPLLRLRASTLRPSAVFDRLRNPCLRRRRRQRFFPNIAGRVGEVKGTVNARRTCSVTR